MKDNNKALTEKSETKYEDMTLDRGNSRSLRSPITDSY